MQECLKSKIDRYDILIDKVYYSIGIGVDGFLFINTPETIWSGKWYNQNLLDFKKCLVDLSAEDVVKKLGKYPNHFNGKETKENILKTLLELKADLPEEEEEREEDRYWEGSKSNNQTTMLGLINGAIHECKGIPVSYNLHEFTDAFYSGTNLKLVLRKTLDMYIVMEYSPTLVKVINQVWPKLVQILNEELKGLSLGTSINIVA